MTDTLDVTSFLLRVYSDRMVCCNLLQFEYERLTDTACVQSVFQCDTPCSESNLTWWCDLSIKSLRPRVSCRSLLQPSTKLCSEFILTVLLLGVANRLVASQLQQWCPLFRVHSDWALQSFSEAQRCDFYLCDTLQTVVISGQAVCAWSMQLHCDLVGVCESSAWRILYFFCFYAPNVT